MNLFGSSLPMRRCAKFPKHAIAQSFGIALTGFCKIHDFVCEHFVGKVTAVTKPERYQSHFVRKAHDPDRLRVEPLAIEVGPDWHKGVGRNSLPAMELIEHFLGTPSIRFVTDVSGRSDLPTRKSAAEAELSKGTIRHWQAAIKSEPRHGGVGALELTTFTGVSGGQCARH